ncbi:ectomycorrhiza-regulated small secreted protein [Laccaria bicolor S238N-H82]|uniref:Ectomycorrhiza-regulated small secreted protein n=1 Tax=Laccaria bicolor (strain S238N-H82 / ATCC MYA-4686) TaxID=486041 RepID=B0D457_LACBS|nr:ectomycorrhiza-regulated small secreted protein [Laccaria bicolor S238N-H82]EDR10516.1 ectomycorrhiza-regulated small secreted protein [Laccaria bicolor S238N-H82]|eukprot:XP_001878966.1 ectomycorrhiza-regulated small secreted protein [Laccaria bicolor S238N-H82]
MLSWLYTTSLLASFVSYYDGLPIFINPLYQVPNSTILTGHTNYLTVHEIDFKANTQ